MVGRLPSFDAKRYARDRSPEPLGAVGSGWGGDSLQIAQVSGSSSAFAHKIPSLNNSASVRLPLYPGERVSARGGTGWNTTGEMGRDSARGGGASSERGGGATGNSGGAEMSGHHWLHSDNNYSRRGGR